MRQSLRNLLLSLFFTLCLFTPNEPAYGKDAPRILLLYSYHPSFPTSRKVTDGLKTGLGDFQTVIELEFMDSKRLIDKTSLNLFYQSLQYKLQHREPFDLVITADDNALNFMLKHGSDLLPGVPVIFLGVNNRELAKEQNSNPDVTGVVEAASIDETIALVRRLKPKTNTLHILADGTVSGQSDLRSTLKLQNQFPELTFDIIDLSELTWDDFAKRIRNIPSNDAILLLSAFKDKTQESHSFEDSFKLISEAASAPVYHPFEHGMGDGVTGGVVISHYEQGRRAALIAIDVLKGTDIASIPVLEKSPNIPVFDKRLLDKFHISPSLLPKGSQIRNHQPSFIKIYWVELSVLLAIFSLLLIIILILARENRLRKAFANTVKESESTLRTILDNVDAYIYMKDATGQYLFANKLLRKHFGLSMEEVISKTDEELFDKNTAKKIRDADNQVFDTHSIYKDEEHFWLEDRELRQDIRTTKIPLINEHNDIYAICGISVDITEQKAYEIKLENIAHYDQLTGLPNRVLFYDRLQQAMKNALRNGTRIAVLYFDLDNFKYINDTYSHAFGDELLKIITSRIQYVIRENDTAARLGGDEFIILLVDSGSLRDEADISKRILQVMSEPVEYEGTIVSVSASIGITEYPQDTPLDPDHLLRQADQAMYMAKNAGRNRFHFYNGELENQAERQQELISNVSSGLEKGEFVLYYQPKIDLANGDLIGAEALIRWQHPEKGILPPGAFLPDIEHHKVMYEIDEWVIRETLKQLQLWLQSGVEIVVSVNVSHLFFKQSDPVNVLKSILKDYPDVPPSLLELEIVETQALDNLTEVADIIRECQKLSVGFALDDFGTGYSSLTYLKQLPINILKVDKSFVIDMLVDKEDKSILEGILALCNAFGIKAIAEGLETHEHGVQLRNMGYHYAQGYGIAKPMPAGQLIEWRQEWKVPKGWETKQ